MNIVITRKTRDNNDCIKEEEIFFLEFLFTLLLSEIVFLIFNKAPQFKQITSLGF